MDYNLYEDIDFTALGEADSTDYSNEELNLARKIVEETDANLFLTGKAGTGKTTFLRKLVENANKRIAVLAPTGVAAINAGGVTINSFLQLPFTPFIPGKGFIGESKFKRYSQNKLKLIRSLDLLVIDEISMVRADTLDGIDHILRKIRRNDVPFGGMQLLMIGDLRQLAPVVKEDEREYLEENYPSLYFFDSYALKQTHFVVVELKKIYRQQDSDFISILNEVRNSSVSSRTLSRLNQRFNPHFVNSQRDSEGYIHLTTHNYQANIINESKMNALPGKEICFTASVSGHFPETSYPAEEALNLKLGAQVMFIRNDSGEDRKYYNGMIGKISRLSDTELRVLPLDKNEEVIVEPVEWENTSLKIDEETGDIKQIVEGRFNQLPLRPAWAITVHKSQGLTFNKAIINIERSFASGQAYVALSRCRTLEGMVLSAPVSYSALITDNAVLNFEMQFKNLRPDSESISQLRSIYYRNLLVDLFNYSEIADLFDSYHRVVKEYIIPLHPALHVKYKTLHTLLVNDVLSVANKFIRIYGNKAFNNIEEQKQLETKIQSSTGYFKSKLQQIIKTIAETPSKVSNTRFTKSLQNHRIDLLQSLTQKISILEYLSDKTFSPKIYAKAKAKAIANESLSDSNSDSNVKEQKPRERNRKEKTEKKPKGYSTFETLHLMQSGLTPKQVAEQRNLKETTIHTHIKQLVELGRLEPEDAFDKETFEQLKKIMDKLPGCEFQTFINATTGIIPFNTAALFYSLYNIKKNKES